MKKAAAYIAGVKKSAPPPRKDKKDIYFNFPRATLDELRITHPNLKDIINGVKKWAALHNRGVKNSLVFLGPNGTGKTHISRAILWSSMLIQPDLKIEIPRGRMLTAVDALSEIDGGNLKNLAFIDRTITPPDRSTPFIIIDDIGSEHDKTNEIEWKTAQIQRLWGQLIDRCYRENIPLILSASNNAGTLEGLKNHLGPRNWDRLLEMAPKGFMWDFAGIPSQRERKGGRGK